MNRNTEHIKSATERYTKKVEKDYLLSPISKIDIDIVNELVEMLKKFEEHGAVRVMEKYKLNPDKEILENLMTLNVQLSQELGDPDFKRGGDGEEKKLPFWFHFNNNGKLRTIRPNIINFAPLDAVGDDDSKYGILINETPENAKQIPFHANQILLYDDEEVRQEDMEMLEELINY